MGFLDIFRPLKSAKQTRWKEMGTYTASFTPFGTDMFRSDLVRSCIRPLVNHTSKASFTCSKPEIAKILNTHPNMYQNTSAFLAKIRIWRELKNTAFVYVQREEGTFAVKGFYPVPYQSFEAIEYMGDLFIKFYFNGDATRELVLPWADLAVLRKDYYKSDIYGEDNGPILDRLSLISTAEQGNANAIRATANLRGILKSTKAMLSKEDIKKQKDQFVTDYLNLENEGGIASLDATQEFTPITMSPTVTNAATLKEYREDVQRYFGVSDAIITGDYTEEQMEAFYDSNIETFLVDLGTEFESKIFTKRELALNNYLVVKSDRINYASTQTKLGMVQLVDRALMTPNEYRALFNWPPYEGGDEFIMRKDTGTTGREDTANE